MAAMSNTLCTPEDIAAYLNVSPEWVREMARAGQIPAMKVGTYWRFRITDIDAWLDQRATFRPARRAAHELVEQ